MSDRVAIFGKHDPSFSAKFKRIMHIYQLVFISILGLQFRNESISIENTTSSLLCCCQLSKRCISELSIAVYSTSRPIKRSYGCLQQLLLIISGTAEINPGPTTKLKYPCGQCNHAVKNSENSIACDSCSKWYHKDCLSMGTKYLIVILIMKILNGYVQTVL